MLWTLYNPWFDALRAWQQVTQRYWGLPVPTQPTQRTQSAPAAHANGHRAAPQPAAAPAVPDESAVVFGLRVGDRRLFTHTVSESHLQSFAAASGDCNPLHMDPEYAVRTRFGERIAHGMLSASFISAALATLGGNEATTVYVSQNLRFQRPVSVGDTISTELKVLQVDPAKHRLTVETVCRNQGGDPVVSGEAVILLDPYPFAA